MRYSIKWTEHVEYEAEVEADSIEDAKQQFEDRNETIVPKEVGSTLDVESIEIN